MAAFLANVGVNASHTAHSALRADGSFELVPIPEKVQWQEPMVRFDSLERVKHTLPRNWLDRAAHVDPDLDSSPATYGDNCRTAGRAFSLRRAQPADVIVFVARLVNHEHTRFHLVGVLEIEALLRDVVTDPGSGWWDSNAHVRRARATNEWDSFWVFKGSVNSRKLDHAIALDRALLRRLFQTEAWNWRPNRTELQTIGSHTRAVRCLTGDAEKHLRQVVCA